MQQGDYFVAMAISGLSFGYLATFRVWGYLGTWGPRAILGCLGFLGSGGFIARGGVACDITPGVGYLGLSHLCPRLGP